MVSRAAFYKKPKGLNMKRYKKKDDDEILIEIKELKEKRPTYGYKRITAV